MAKRKNFEDVINNEKKGAENFFKSTKKVSDEDELKRRTYYLNEILIQALALMSARTSKDKSEIVRDSLESTIPKKYIIEAQEIINNRRG